MTIKKIAEKLGDRFPTAEVLTFKDGKERNCDGYHYEDDGNIHYTYNGTRYCLDFGQTGEVKGKEIQVVNFFKKL